jgi:hypothetical protein
MKTKQTKIDRSAAKWLPGAMALAATTASSQAATVQITLTGNKISSTGNQLVADLTGDGNADLALNNAWASAGAARVMVNGGWVWATEGFMSGGVRHYSVDANFASGAVGNAGGSGPGPRTASYLNPISFTDPQINGGSTTGGWVHVIAYNTSATSHTVELSRLIFDDASTVRPSFPTIPSVQTEWQVSAVPEPGSNLALLALGAGGLTLRRRLKRAA